VRLDAEPSSHRVVPDVFARSAKVLVVANNARMESILKEVAGATVKLVESLRVDAVQPV
jgi:hypothetical protein